MRLESLEQKCESQTIDSRLINELHYGSAIALDLIELNFKRVEGALAYDYLLYSSKLKRTNTGRLTAQWLKRYQHIEDGGWWVSTEADPLWGAFKPDTPFVNPDTGKLIKYEHPPAIETTTFRLSVPMRIWWMVAERHGLSLSLEDRAGGFWEWVKAHPELPILLAEGAKKAATLLSAGYVAIALPGIFSGRRVLRDESGKAWDEFLIPDLQAFAVSGRTISFCFDADRKPKTIKNVNLAIIKTGRLIARCGCTVKVVCLPLLSGFDKIGVDDFIVAQSAEAFEQIYQQASSLAGFEWRIRQARELTCQPWQVLNIPDLSKASLDIPDHGIIALKSGKGTGKTKAIGAAVARSGALLLLTHRIALGRNLSGRIGCDWKSDIDRANGEFLSDSGYTARIGLCVDSLLAINPQKFVGCDLVVDEAEQVLRHLLTSSTCNQEGKRPALLARLTDLVKVARRVILADADISDRSINYFKALRGENTPLYLIRNDYKSNGYPVRFIEAAKDDAVITELLADVKAGHRIFVAIDAKSGSKAIAKLIADLQAVRPGIRVMLVNSETSGDEPQTKLIQHINERVRDYDVLIVTPSLSTGASIEVEHFDKVYGIFFGVLSDSDIAQFLARVRSNVPRTVWCEKTGKNFSNVSKSEYPFLLKEALRLRWHREAELLRTSLGCPDTLSASTFEIEWDVNPHIKLWSEIAADINTSMWNLRENVLERLLSEGNQVEVVSAGDDLDGGSLMKEARKQVEAERCVAIAGARLLDQSERAALESKEALAYEDSLALEKTRLSEFYCVNEVAPSLVEMDQEGRLRMQLLELEGLLYGTAAERDLKALEKQFKWKKGVLPFDQLYNEMRRHARERLGLKEFLDPTREWAVAEFKSLGEKVRGAGKQIPESLGFNPSKMDDASIFQRLMQQLGVSVSNRRQGPRGQQIKLYRIDKEKWDELQAILERRAERRSQAEGNSRHATVVNPSTTGISSAPGKMPSDGSLNSADPTVVTPTPASEMYHSDTVTTPVVNPPLYKKTNGVNYQDCDDQQTPTNQTSTSIYKGAWVSWSGHIGAWLVEDVEGAIAKVRQPSSPFQMSWPAPLNELIKI
ncbi:MULTISPECIES: plasmid replication protein, CyRepA1 family [Trichocoleus]|uniref:DUF3854 domain-containing protein n=1 Tax=Trichocoleus desertorum GB2-A4 TaxID=2933944 RepID=A0ABV0JG33_9CYAN|nr:plasmid replication protein, CyRepA1 family [Trichocoleus sp. FACHB-46]MBD1865686.1 DUF3854 domain-containing protein [Trichocoleus sp. FACHB-46]